jgi:hypothetical protein
MHLAKNLKPALYCLAGLALATSSIHANATPVYLLLEGTITGSLETQSCYPNCTWTDRNVGKTVKIQAVWDDKKIFGNDVNTDPNKGHYGSSGSIGTTFEVTNWMNPMNGQRIPSSEPQPPGWQPDGSAEYGAHYYPLSPDHSWETDTSWQQYSITTDGQTFVNKLTGFLRIGCNGASCETGPDAGWKFDLATENNSGQGDLATFSYTSVNNGGYYAFNLNLKDISQSALDQQLFGFNWDSSKGGSATGLIDSVYSMGGGQGGTLTNNIAWSRAVLTYNSADLAAVPIPAAAWMFGSCLLSLVGGRSLAKGRGIRRRK